jgi:RNA polymerase sigma factor (TIGR02999 family)
LRSEPDECEFEPSELVHEAYLRLLNRRTRWNDDRHFLNLAAQMMRCILCDQARGRSRLKRGCGSRKIDLGIVDLPSSIDVEKQVAAKERVGHLLGSSERWGHVVRLRMEGFSTDEIARSLRISRRTVKRDWRLAKSQVGSEQERACRADYRRILGGRLPLKDLRRSQGTT